MSIPDNLVSEGDLSSSPGLSSISSQQGSSPATTQPVPNETTSSNTGPENALISDSSSSPISSQQGDPSTATESVPAGTTNSEPTPENVASSTVGSVPVSSQQGSASNATQSVPSGTTSTNTSVPTSISPRDRTRHLNFNGYCSDSENPQEAKRRRMLLRKNQHEAKLKELRAAAAEYEDSRLNPHRPPWRRRDLSTAGSCPTEEASGSGTTSIAPVSGQNPPPESSALSPSSPKPGAELGKAGCKPPRRHHGSLNRELMPPPSSSTTPSDTMSPSMFLKLQAQQRNRKPQPKDQSPTHGPLPKAQPPSSTTPSDTMSPSMFLKLQAQQRNRKPQPKDQSPTHGPLPKAQPPSSTTPSGTMSPSMYLKLQAQQRNRKPQLKGQPPSSPRPSDTASPSPDSTPSAKQCKYRLKVQTAPKRPSRASSQPKPTTTPSSSLTPSDADDNRLCVRRKPSRGSLRRRPAPRPSPSTPAEQKLCIKQGKWRLPHDRSVASQGIHLINCQLLSVPSERPSRGPPQCPPQGSAPTPPQSPPPAPPQNPPPTPPPSPPPSRAVKLLTQALSDLLTPKAPPTQLAQAQLLYRQHISGLRSQRSATEEKLRERAWVQKQLEKSDSSQRMLRNLEGAASTATSDMQRQKRAEAVHLRMAHYQEKEAKLLKQLTRVSRSAMQMRRTERSLVCAIEAAEAVIKKEGGTVESWRRQAGVDRWKVEHVDGEKEMEAGMETGTEG